MDAAGRGVGQGVGDAAAVADDVKAGIAGLQPVADLDFHVVELDLHAVEQGVVVGGAGGHLVQSVDHFDDAVQDALGQHQAQVAGGCLEGGGDEGLLHAAGSGTTAPDQIAEPLDDDAAAQHVAQTGDGFAVAVGILEGLGEMLGNQQGEVGVLRLEGRILVAVAVDGDDAVGVLVDHGALGVHAEGAHLVAVLLGAVDDLAFIELIGQMGEYRRGQLHPDADVHTVGLGGNVQLLADLFHPLAAASAHGDDALFAAVGILFADHAVAAGDDLHGLHRGVEEEVHLVLQVVVDVFQNDVVDVRAQMPHGGVQQVQVVLDAQGLEPGTGGGVQLAALAAVAHIDLIHIVHQIQSMLLADVFVQRAAEVVGDVVLAVGKGARAAETAHDGAAFTADTGLDLVAVDGTAALFQCMASLENGHFQLRLRLHQLISRKNTAGTGADDDHIIIHRGSP